ncbi:MAG: hypothetical protein ACREL7_07100 [Longimicrobiales bacterium]
MFDVHVIRSARGFVITVTAMHALIPRSAAAQRADLESRCVANAGGAAAEACADLTDILDIVAARTTLAAAGGNPVLGTASTIGHRIPGQPRLALSTRFALVPIEIPAPDDPGGTRTSSFTATAWGVDAVVGLFSGFSPAPTVGGMGSIDLFIGGGAVQLASSEGFRSHAPGTWAVGARLGVLRESFTMPGVSLSVQFRHMENWNAGDVRLAESEAFVRADDAVIWSLRGTVGKRLGPFGFTAGAGFDRTKTDAILRLPAGVQPVETRFDSWHSDRTNVFANAAWTRVIVTFTAEAGWQSGASDRSEGRPGGGGLWGSAGARVTF